MIPHKPLFFRFPAFAVALAAAAALLLAACTGPAAPPFPLLAIGIVVAATCAILSGWGIWTAIGIFRRRGWARVSIVIFAALLTFMAGSAGLVILVMRLPAQPNVTQGMMDAIRWGMGGFYSLLAAIGVWWLVLFNLSSTKIVFFSNLIIILL